MDFEVTEWREALASYKCRIGSLGKPELMKLDDFYREELPILLHERDPTPFITQSELYKLMQWKLTRGKWRPRLLDFISSLDETQVKSTSEKAFQSLPDIAKAVTELPKLKGVGPATASAILAAYAPDVAPFMSDEAMVAAIGNSKDYSFKQYLVFAEKLQNKAKELSANGNLLTPSDVERALWSSATAAKLTSSLDDKPKANKKRRGRGKSVADMLRREKVQQIMQPRRFSNSAGENSVPVA